MKEYKVKSVNAKSFCIELDTSLIGELKYQSWHSNKSEIHMPANLVYKIEPKGFWGNTIEISDGKNVVISLVMKWNGNMLISSRVERLEKQFIFTQKGFFNSTYILSDNSDQGLVEIKPDFKWKKLNYDYSINTTLIFENLPGKNLILLAILYCAIYAVKRTSESVIIT